MAFPERPELTRVLTRATHALSLLFFGSLIAVSSDAKSSQVKAEVDQFTKQQSSTYVVTEVPNVTPVIATQTPEKILLNNPNTIVGVERFSYTRFGIDFSKPYDVYYAPKTWVAANLKNFKPDDLKFDFNTSLIASSHPIVVNNYPSPSENTEFGKYNEFPGVSFLFNWREDVIAIEAHSGATLDGRPLMADMLNRLFRSQSENQLDYVVDNAEIILHQDGVISSFKANSAELTTSSNLIADYKHIILNAKSNTFFLATCAGEITNNPDTQRVMIIQFSPEEISNP